MKPTLIRVKCFVAVLLLLSPLFFIYREAQALPLFGRSVSTSSSIPGATVTQTFSFTPGSIGPVASLSFQYCANSPLFDDPCTAPLGLNLSGAVLASQSGNVGFSIDSVSSSANKFVLTRTSSVFNAVASTYNFSNVVNPSTSGQTVFVRISSYGSNNGTGTMIDRGAVAYSLQEALNVGAYVPPFINLCVAITVEINCSNGSGSSLDFGSLSSTKSSAGSSQLAVATNDPSGYSVYTLGTTMTSGNNVITALASPSASLPGVSQFGINLRQNGIPSVGNNIDGPGTGLATVNYAQINQYMYSEGDIIASASQSSDYSRMTVSYIVNVAKNQAPGVYSTTLTFVAAVQF